MVKLSNVVLTLNRKSEEFVKKVDVNKGQIIPNFIDDLLISDTHDIREIVSEALYVGHVKKSKGCFEILEAAKRLPDVHFTLVGPVSHEIETCDCPSNVSLVGEKTFDEVKQYLQKADVFVFPSYTEGFSLSLTEAMAMGLPCIATDVGANADMIECDGGIIIPVKDVSAIVEAVEKIQSKDVRSKMSVWNQNKVRQHYLLNGVMKSVMDVYHDIID